MAYSTTADIIARITEKDLVSLLDQEQLATASTTLAAAIALNATIQTRLDAAIADADGLVDSYVRKQYSVPLESTPAQIKRIAVDLVVFFCHKAQRSGLGIPEQVRTDYKDARAYLEHVAAGKVDLGVEPPPAESAKASYAQADGEDRIMTDDNLSRF